MRRAKKGPPCFSRTAATFDVEDFHVDELFV